MSLVIQPSVSQLQGLSASTVGHVHGVKTTLCSVRPKMLTAVSMQWCGPMLMLMLYMRLREDGDTCPCRYLILEAHRRHHGQEAPSQTSACAYLGTSTCLGRVQGGGVSEQGTWALVLFDPSEITTNDTMASLTLAQLGSTSQGRVGYADCHASSLQTTAAPNKKASMPWIS